ncbi:MAG TPA: VOC family protein [Actinomycetota bacterium]|nr:VOC family protein [Actinomycetota bacterium]
MDLTHVRLLVEDFAECFRFYRDVMGLEPSVPDEHGPYAEFKLGGDRYLALFDRALMAEAVGTTGLPAWADVQDRGMLIFEVADPDAEAERLRGQGIPITAEPENRPLWGLRTVHLRDPDGNLIELYRRLTKEES